MTSRRGPRQVWLIPTVLLFVVLPVGGAVYSAVASTDALHRPPKLSREGSKALGRESVPLALDDEPLSYEVVYALERYDRDRVHHLTDRIQVRRPFDGRFEDAATGHQPRPRISRLGSLVLSTGAGPRSLVNPPSPATGDLRFAPVLAEAVEDRFVEVRERRRVLGRECQVYRAGSSVSAGLLTPVGKRVGEYSDFCVDRAGLLLEEVWVKDRKPLLRRVATKLTVGVELPGSRFELSGEVQVPFEEGNGFYRPIDPQSGFEGTSYRLVEDPSGFDYLGRFAVEPPRLNPFQSRLEEGQTRSQVSVIDVWQRGPDMVTLAQTIAADISAVPQNSLTAKPLRIGGFGSASTVLDLRASQVRIELPEDRFLQVAGTLSRAELVDIAKSLRAEVGTGLKFLDEAH
ncbi:MAG TPA: hypothetical protein VM143_07375 [Acidimicrobiales bacterium]|nr:hypothetical protein [Acidimicrobiales bacterium]